MKLKFKDMLAQRITKETILNWELHHRIFCVKNYYKCGSVMKISDQFHIFFEIDREPHKSIIQDWVSKFKTHVTQLSLIRNPLTVPAILEEPGLVHSKLQRWSVERSPKRSLWRRSQPLNLSISTGRKVIVTNLNKYLYRILTKQKLTVAIR